MEKKSEITIAFVNAKTQELEDLCLRYIDQAIEKAGNQDQLSLLIDGEENPGDDPNDGYIRVSLHRFKKAKEIGRNKISLILEVCRRISKIEEKLG